MGESEALERVRQDVARLDPSWVDPIETMRQPLADWHRWPAPRLLQYLRHRLLWSQADLARSSGVSRRQITRLEAGEDAGLDIWRRVFAAMGFEMNLWVTTALTKNELRDRAEAACPPHRRYRQRARSRRRFAP